MVEGGNVGRWRWLCLGRGYGCCKRKNVPRSAPGLRVVVGEQKSKSRCVIVLERDIFQGEN